MKLLMKRKGNTSYKQLEIAMATNEWRSQLIDYASVTGNKGQLVNAC